uniref:VWFA domain-containing protein n=1 Tax=Hyaloperonospora arabidopsidis (strain Emoy2) TaxID=559515 RepID=M4BB84_HYAAE
MCTLDGICEQKVHIKKSSRTYKGLRGSFEYIHEEMNGSKKRCKHVIAAGKEDHEGLEHSCVAQSLDDEDGQDIVHFCDVRCSCCSYCNKHVGHLGLHDTSHGNMRSTYFLAKDTDIEVREHKYKVGESGTAEMCNLFSAKMGRGHVHYLSCEGSAGERCVYAGGDASIVSQDQRRHCTDTLYPVPERAMEELLHSKFWSTIGWADPCNDNERALFAMCRFQCDAPEHEEEGKLPSYCVLEAWHQPEIRPEEGDEKFAYIDGHKFECVHTVDSGKFHNVFVLDSSGSMSGQPWQDLLYACNEFVTSRLKDGGENDLVSFVTFDHESRIFCEKVPLH